MRVPFTITFNLDIPYITNYLMRVHVHLTLPFAYRGHPLHYPLLNKGILT